MKQFVDKFQVFGLIIVVLFATAGCPTGTAKSPGTLETTGSNIPEPTVRVDLDSRRPALKLSEYGLFQDIASQTLISEAVPYELNFNSFVDQATTQSYVYLPPGQKASFQPKGPFKFPVGTILVQNIRFPIDVNDPAKGNRLVETRLLIKKNFGWTGVPYVWNENQTDADRAVIGEKTEIALVGRHGHSNRFSYLTPNMNECKRCHLNDESVVPIGVTARNLNRTISTEDGEKSQLEHWRGLGLLEGLPADRNSIAKLPDWREVDQANVGPRARAWLDANCAHCHSPGGPAIVSGLDLSFDQTQPIRFGVYKPPVAAGRGSGGLQFSILPGKPEESFLLHRVNSTELGVMMPPLGRSLKDNEGSELLNQWIKEMPVDEALAEAALNPTKAYQTAVSGGDADRGKILFHQTQKCGSCHRIGGEGGEVGPNLSDVGKRKKPEYLLESLVDPNAEIAKGFQTEVVMTNDGRIVTGIVISEDQYEVVIADANDQYKITKAEIEERQKSKVSTMPSLANILTVEEVGHLIAYLRSLQESPENGN